MNGDHSDPRSAMTADTNSQAVHQSDDDPAASLKAESGISAGARAVNRLLWSLWFSLSLVLWPSSDWIGLLIFSQALLAASRLLQTPNTTANSANSASNESDNAIEGGYRVH